MSEPGPKQWGDTLYHTQINSLFACMIYRGRSYGWVLMLGVILSDNELALVPRAPWQGGGVCGLIAAAMESLIAAAMESLIAAAMESLIAAAIQFGNEFPQSAFDSSCYPIWQQVPTVYSSRTNQEVCSHAHLCFAFCASHCSNPSSEFFCKFSLWTHIKCKPYHANKSILYLLVA